MKKILVLIVVLSIMALPLGGCCTRVDPVTKANTKTFGNCVAAAQDLLCNPTDQQKAEAASVVAFLAGGVQVAGIFINVPITAAEVVAIFGMVQSGGCVLANDMQLALSWYAALSAALNTQAAAAKLTGKKGVAMAPPVINALYVW